MMHSEVICGTCFLHPPELSAPLLSALSNPVDNLVQDHIPLFWKPYLIISALFFLRTPDNLSLIAFVYLVITVYISFIPQ